MMPTGANVGVFILGSWTAVSSEQGHHDM